MQPPPLPLIPGFRPVPMTGVIYVTTRANEHGFSTNPSEWANLGQGAPEVGPLAQQLPATEVAYIDPGLREYSPVVGLTMLRQKIADLYNAVHRQGKESLYTAENVAIASGGRSALTRLAASIGDAHVGHCIPDYTAYEELLTIFKSFTPIPLVVTEEEGYVLSPEALRHHMRSLGLSVILLSNPCNPTGQVVRGEELQAWLATAREEQCTLIFDEFYSHYMYDIPERADYAINSAAAFVEDVDKDPVVIVDGLTKNWRYPGWRISWTLGPKNLIKSLASAGSFLDGGAPHPLQRSACEFLEPEDVRKNSRVLRQTFQQKRDYVVSRVRNMGIDVPCPPQGAFYCWCSLKNLPEHLRDGLKFFEAGLSERVITVPGEFFDVNPGKRRRSSAFKEYCRISFGPSMPVLERGLDALERVIGK